MRRAIGMAVCGAVAAASAHAEIYKCKDEQGHVTYSNVAQKGCQTLNLEPLPTVPGPAKPAVKPAQSPTGFPKVDGDTQKKRDADRRRILDEELATEEKHLDEARKALAEQEAVRLGDERNYQKYLDRVQPYKDKVALHERNIEAIKREIGNLR